MFFLHNYLATIGIIFISTCCYYSSLLSNTTVAIVGEGYKNNNFISTYDIYLNKTNKEIFESCNIDNGNAPILKEIKLRILGFLKELNSKAPSNPIREVHEKCCSKIIMESGSDILPIPKIYKKYMLFTKKFSSKIVNLSLESTRIDAIFFMEFVEDNPDILFIVSANNDGENIDEINSYPASYTAKNLITVAAVDEDDSLRNSSNYGKKTVDVAALGRYECKLENEIHSLAGTSFAAPIVTRIAAKIKDIVPNITPEKIISIICDTTDKTDELLEKTRCGGIVNEEKAIANAKEISKNYSALKDQVFLNWPPKNNCEAKNECILYHITSLSLNNKGIKKIDAKDFHYLENLDTLYLYGNAIEKIEGLENLKNLRRLFLGGNEVTQIENLSHLSKLEALSLKENKIEEIDGLENLIALKNLDLSNNILKSLGGLERLFNLKIVNLKNNLLDLEEEQTKETIEILKQRGVIVYF